MSVKGTFHGDEDAYYCGVKNQSTDELQAKRNVKVAKIASFGVSATAGVVFSVHTLGISLLGTAYSSRQISILQQQVHIIDCELKSRSANIPRVRMRDVAFGAAAGTISSTLGIVLISIGVHDLVGDALTSAAAGTTTLAPHVTIPAAHGAVHGVHDAFFSQTQFMSDGDHIPADPCGGAGYALGVTATMKAESMALSLSAGCVADKAAEKAVHSL